MSAQSKKDNPTDDLARTKPSTSSARKKSNRRIGDAPMKMKAIINVLGVVLNEAPLLMQPLPSNFVH